MRPLLIDLRLSEVDTDELQRLKRQQKALEKEKTDKAKKELKNVEKLIEDEKKRLRSDWEQGTPKFKKKVYYSVARGTDRPQHWLTWERYDSTNGYREYREAFARGERPVQSTDGLYWAEPVPPNEKGYYVNGDLILMQQDLLTYLERRAEEIKIARLLPQQKMKEFDAMVEAAKAGVGEAIEKLASL